MKPNNMKPSNKYNPVLAKAVYDLRQSGVSWRGIASELGYARADTVRSAYRSYERHESPIDPAQAVRVHNLMEEIKSLINSLAYLQSQHYHKLDIRIGK